MHILGCDNNLRSFVNNIFRRGSFFDVAEKRAHWSSLSVFGNASRQLFGQFFASFSSLKLNIF